MKCFGFWFLLLSRNGDDYWGLKSDLTSCKHELWNMLVHIRSIYCVELWTFCVYACKSTYQVKWSYWIFRNILCLCSYYFLHNKTYLLEKSKKLRRWVIWDGLTSGHVITKGHLMIVHNWYSITYNSKE